MIEDLKEVAKGVVEQKAEAKQTTSKDYINGLRDELVKNSKSAAGTSELVDLVNLIVITYQETTMLKTGMMDFVNQFIVEARDDNGNGVREIKHYPQPGEDWDNVKNKFIPSELSDTAFTVQFIKFKEADGTLAEGSRRKVFNATYSTADMITYFINGQLLDFIQKEILGKIKDSVIISMYDFVMQEVIKPCGKQISGKAANLFDALTTEVFPECGQMLLNSSDYNVDQTNKLAIDASDKEDLIMLVSPNLKTKLESNIMSQLFNSQRIELTNFVGAVYTPNRKFKSQNGTWTTEDSSYLDDNTIIVIDRKNYFRVIKMLEFAGNQNFPLNMAAMQVLHLWFASGKLGWGKAFFYTNANLSVMPGNEV